MPLYLCYKCEPLQGLFVSCHAGSSWHSFAILSAFELSQLFFIGLDQLVNPTTYLDLHLLPLFFDDLHFLIMMCCILSGFQHSLLRCVFDDSALICTAFVLELDQKSQASNIQS